MFFESLRIPFAAWCCEEVTSVHMDCGRNLFQWIGNRMYHCFTEGNNVLRVDCLSSQLDETIFAPAIKGIIFSSSVDPYHRPHQMVVRIQTHERTPQDVEDRQPVRTKEGLDSRQCWLTQCFQYVGRICHRSCDNLFHGGV